MARSTNPHADANTSAEQPSFEQALTELEAIVHELEEGNLGLADSLAKYEQGVGHLKRCYHLLKAAEQKIELLTGVATDGTAISEPFRDEGLSLEEQAGTRRRKRAGSAGNSEDAGAGD